MSTAASAGHPSGQFRHHHGVHPLVEHAIGRLKNLGVGSARYFGRAKTRAQWLWAAAVANLSLVWGREAAMAR